MTRRTRVLIAGGGVGAIEAALALRELGGDRLHLTLLAPNAAFELAPDTVAEVAGGPPAPRFDLAKIASDIGAELVGDALDGVDVGERRATTRGGRQLPYDCLLLAVGALPGPVLPGAVRFAGRRDVESLRAALELVRQCSHPSIAFVATSGVGWTLPLYELALLVAAGCDAEGRGRDIVVVTPEASPLALFGRRASHDVARQLSERHVSVRPGTTAEAVQDGILWLGVDGSLPVDLAVALPEPLGPSVPGLPMDHAGFVPVDRYGRVAGSDCVWAVGDMTARRVKQGGLTAQQADAAALSIAAWAGAPVEPRPFEPELRGLLLTGAATRFLRRSPSSSVPSAASERPLWSPAVKVVGRHLGRYLASREDLRLEPGTPEAS